MAANRERIIILGAGVMQGPAIKIAKEMGLFTVVLDGDPGAPCVSLADRFEHIDLKDKEGVEAFAQSLLKDGGLGGIMTAGTDFSATVAWTAERLGLPGIPYEAALNASDKGRMRRCFDAAGIPSPAFTVTGKNESFTIPAPFPLVVKPVDNMGARGCRRVDTEAELEEALAGGIKYSRSGRAIVEAYMEGPEFSVDAIVYRGEIIICGLADRHIFFPPYFIEMGHTMPTAFSSAEQGKLLDCFRAAVRSLGIAGKNCMGAAKGDVKLTPAGPMIGEVAARLSGGYMSGWTYPYSSGVEPVRAAVEMAVGREPRFLKPLKSWTSAERAFISIPGKIKSIEGLEKARNTAHVKDLFLRIAEDSPVSFPVNNVSKCGNVISAAENREDACRAAEEAARSILIRLEAPNAETSAFLSALPVSTENAESFPPGAFGLSRELKAVLESLPSGIVPRKNPSGNVSIYPFPAFLDSGLTDYMGRGVTESLEALRTLSGLPLPVGTEEPFLGKEFWQSLIRGGYQGAVYYLDTPET
ncbi:MAG: ATP-grasp domain-containing protein [Treponema sp.]|nr:ATP-grasp domain-containing protein [Treponema sp.]